MNSACDGGVGCFTSEMFCCSLSPVRFAVVSFPDWTKLFAETLLLRPQLLDQLNNVTVDHNGKTIDCSLDEIEERREQLLNDTNQYCQNYTCHEQVSRAALSVRTLFKICITKAG